MYCENWDRSFYFFCVSESFGEHKNMPFPGPVPQHPMIQLVWGWDLGNVFFFSSWIILKSDHVEHV